MKSLTRAGIRTTEFWLALLAFVAINLAALYSDQPWAHLAAIVGDAIVAAGYGFARSSVKRTEVAAESAANERRDVIKMQAAAAAQTLLNKNKR